MGDSQAKVSEFSIPLPKSLDTHIYIRLSTMQKVVMLSLTTASPEEPAAPVPMGSFIYALPNRYDDKQPLATTIFSHEPTFEFTTRMGKFLARRLQLPVYVTNSISFANTGMGGTVEEEVDAFKSVVEVIMSKLYGAGLGPGVTNGASA